MLCVGAARFNELRRNRCVGAHVRRRTHAVRKQVRPCVSLSRCMTSQIACLRRAVSLSALTKSLMRAQICVDKYISQTHTHVLHTCMHLHLQRHSCKCRQIHACTQQHRTRGEHACGGYVYVCVFACACICVCVCVLRCVSLYICMSMRVCIRACVCVYLYGHGHAYAYSSVHM